MSRAGFAASLALAACGALGCLPAFAPNLRARGQHSAMTPATDDGSCMACHVSEQDALAQGGRASAPIVAEWMLDDPRDCVDCHRVSLTRAHREPR